jgi:hypothetical protein
MKSKIFKMRFTIFALVAYNFSFSGNSTSLLKTIQNENPPYKEEYYVLKSDTSIKHGSYNKYAFPKQIVTSGFYKNGKKDSIWTDYNRETNAPINKGAFFNGQKKGVWEYNFPNGELALKFDHSLAKNIFCKNCSDTNSKKVLVLKDTGFVFQTAQREPFFNGDSKQLNIFLLKSIENDLKKITKNSNKTVLFQLIIDNDGHASKQMIISGINAEIDYKLLNQFKLIPDEWIPAIVNGKPILSKTEFTFQLP